MERIVVATGESTGIHPAVDWAMRFASGRGALVELVHVIDTTWDNITSDRLATEILEAEEKLRSHAELARLHHPGVLVTSHVRLGSTTRELIAASDGAALLVVSAHPDNRHDGASRSLVRLVGAASCSVVLAPSIVIPSGQGVVVGVDGSRESDAAAQFAAGFAAQIGEPLTVILARGYAESWGIGEPSLIASAMPEGDPVLSDTVSALRVFHPGLEVRPVFSDSQPERALCDAANDARLLVVGSRGRHGLAKVLLGSVSESVVMALPSAVAVIRDTASASNDVHQTRR